MGELLHSIQMRLQEVMIELGNRYGTTNKAVVAMRRTNAAMVEARSKMDSQCYEDDPAEFTAHIYYPG